MRPIFFYGLFMDRSLLVEKGLDPEVIGPAVLRDYRLHIGERATLVPATARRAYGVVMTLTEKDVETLYADPSVDAYVAERVRVDLLETTETVDADCYNLPRDAALSGANPTYARALARLAEALRFDPAYVDEIAAFDQGS